MLEIPNKEDYAEGDRGKLYALEYNSGKNEILNVIRLLQTPNQNDEKQLLKAINALSSIGIYKDIGTTDIELDLPYSSDDFLFTSYFSGIFRANTSKDNNVKFIVGNHNFDILYKNETYESGIILNNYYIFETVYIDNSYKINIIPLIDDNYELKTIDLSLDSNNEAIIPYEVKGDPVWNMGRVVSSDSNDLGMELLDIEILYDSTNDQYKVRVLDDRDLSNYIVRFTINVKI